MTWEKFEKEIQKLASQITGTPDMIVGIVRGGIIPARLLSAKLRVKDMYCLTVKKYGKERKVASGITDDLHYKKVLLVEDMLETGKSLVVAKEYLESKGAIVTTVCLYTLPYSEIKPDYFVKEINEIVKFPWE